MVTRTFRPSPSGWCRGRRSSNSARCPNRRRLNWRCWSEESVLHLGATILMTIGGGMGYMLIRVEHHAME
jgi:hypothetical protein